MDSTSPSDTAAGGAAAPLPVAFKSRAGRAKGNFRKRPAPSATTSADKDPSDSSNNSSSDEEPSVAKRRRHGTWAITSASSNKETNSRELFPTRFQADREVPLTDTNDATKRSDWFDEPAKKGPLRSSTNVRMTIATDFAPDVCKDYKKTGWCGFGDSCVFLHDRSDAKQGWELDRQWETFVKGKKDLGGTVVSNVAQKKSEGNDSRAGADDQGEEEDEEMLASIPFVCIICQEPYKSPVVTRCGHYFCESCALKRYKRDPSCMNCGASTNGVFNTATKLDRLLKRRRNRAASPR
ncbi:hypothetical protein DL771_007865 [Monosporascus sp. 5C6A]|nr:hypothetical protein DL771_007865 [Monosporascus sp. 5C6A]